MVSLIVPIYNAESFLDRCLRSIQGQTYTDFEVLLIDDGSNDKSLLLCQKYASIDKRMKVIQGSHCGVSAARNKGLDLAAGEWVAFIDSDDWIEKDFLQTLLSVALDTGAEVVACGFSRVYHFVDKRDANINPGDLIVLEGTEACVANLLSDSHSIHGMVWNKLYRKEVLDGIRFDTALAVNEDCKFSYEVMSRCTKAVLTEAELYNWYQRKDSLSHSRKIVTNFDAANIFLYLLGEAKKLNDKYVEKCLKMNYFRNVVDKLARNNVEMSDNMIMEALGNCKEFYPEVRGKLNSSDKIKFLASRIRVWVKKVTERVTGNGGNLNA